MRCFALGRQPARSTHIPPPSLATFSPPWLTISHPVVRSCLFPCCAQRSRMPTAWTKQSLRSPCQSYLPSGCDTSRPRHGCSKRQDSCCYKNMRHTLTHRAARRRQRNERRYRIDHVVSLLSCFRMVFGMCPSITANSNVSRNMSRSLAIICKNLARQRLGFSSCDSFITSVESAIE